MEATQSNKPANTGSNAQVILFLICLGRGVLSIGFLLGLSYGTSSEKELQELRKQGGVPVYISSIRKAEEFCNNGHGGLLSIDVGERKYWYQDTMDKITCADRTWVYSHQIQK